MKIKYILLLILLVIAQPSLTMKRVPAWDEKEFKAAREKIAKQQKVRASIQRLRDLCAKAKKERKNEN